MMNFSLSNCAVIMSLVGSLGVFTPAVGDAPSPELSIAPSGQARFQQTSWNRSHALVADESGLWDIHFVEAREHRSPRSAACAISIYDAVDDAIVHHAVPLGGEVVLTAGWIHVAVGGRVRGFPDESGSVSSIRSSGALDTHVYDLDDVVSYQLTGSCWQSAPVLPPGCDLKAVCEASENPFATECRLTIDLLEDDGPIFTAACGSGLTMEVCGSGGTGQLRVYD